VTALSQIWLRTPLGRPQCRLVLAYIFHFHRLIFGSAFLLEQSRARGKVGRVRGRGRGRLFFEAKRPSDRLNTHTRILLGNPRRVRLACYDAAAVAAAAAAAAAAATAVAAGAAAAAVAAAAAAAITAAAAVAVAVAVTAAAADAVPAAAADDDDDAATAPLLPPMM